MSKITVKPAKSERIRHAERSQSLCDWHHTESAGEPCSRTLAAYVVPFQGRFVLCDEAKIELTA